MSAEANTQVHLNRSKTYFYIVSIPLLITAIIVALIATGFGMYLGKVEHASFMSQRFFLLFPMAALFLPFFIWMGGRWANIYLRVLRNDAPILTIHSGGLSIIFLNLAFKPEWKQLREIKRLKFEKFPWNRVFPEMLEFHLQDGILRCDLNSVSGFERNLLVIPNAVRLPMAMTTPGIDVVENQLKKAAPDSVAFTKGYL